MNDGEFWIWWSQGPPKYSEIPQTYNLLGKSLPFCPQIQLQTSSKFLRFRDGPPEDTFHLRGSVRLFAAAAIKKLCAQEVSLFCVFKTGLPGIPRPLYAVFGSAQRERFAFVFGCRAMLGPSARAIAPGGTVHQFTWHKADIARLSADVRFRG